MGNGERHPMVTSFAHIVGLDVTGFTFNFLFETAFGVVLMVAFWRARVVVRQQTLCDSVYEAGCGMLAASAGMHVIVNCFDIMLEQRVGKAVDEDVVATLDWLHEYFAHRLTALSTIWLMLVLCTQTNGSATQRPHRPWLMYGIAVAHGISNGALSIGTRCMELQLPYILMVISLYIVTEATQRSLQLRYIMCTCLVSLTVQVKWILYLHRSYNVVSLATFGDVRLLSDNSVPLPTLESSTNWTTFGPMVFTMLLTFTVCKLAM